MIKAHCDVCAVRLAKGDYRKIGIKRIGRADKIIARSDPINFSILQQLAAILPDGRLHPQPIVTSAIDVLGCVLSCKLCRLYHCIHGPLAKLFVLRVAVDGDRRWRMMRMTRVHHDVLGGNPALPLNPSGNLIKPLCSMQPGLSSLTQV